VVATSIILYFMIIEMNPQKKEAKWQTIWNHYLREKRKEGKMYGYYELKQTIKNTFTFSKIEIHQYDGLQTTEKEGLVWKWSDDDRREKPLDCASLPPLPSYLVIKFPEAYYMIRISDVVKLRESGKLGITIEEASIIAEQILVLG